jgi:hypothetical protein
MLLNDHAGLYGPGDVEPGTDERSTWLADLRAEREEEIEWLADRIAPLTPLSRELVVDVLWQRERVLAEADSQP